MAAIAANPIQASIELEHALRQNAIRRRVKSSCAVLDDMLKGGLDSGRICCISGDKNTGKTTVRSLSK
jgi:RecA/RadA recombinase